MQECEVTSARALSRNLVLVLDLKQGLQDNQTWSTIQALAVGSRLGGVLLRGGESDQWQSIIAAIRKSSSNPPLFMADLEQGAASQLPGFSWLPKAFTVGATGQPDFAFELGHVVGGQARQLGLDLVLAPVGDLHFASQNAVIGARSFGSTPEKVAEMVSAYVRGCQSQGVGCVVKHFPGHGRAKVDSHSVLPEILIEKSLWLDTDFLPFAAAMDAEVKAIMIGHLWIQGLDPEIKRPSSLSSKIMRHVLRQELSYNGLIITDSFEMGGVGQGDLEAARKAIDAGADLVIGPNIENEQNIVGPAPVMRPEEQERSTDQQADATARLLSLEIAKSSIAWVGGRSSALLAGKCGNMGLKLLTETGGSQCWAQRFASEVFDRVPGAYLLKDDKAVDTDEKDALVFVVSRRGERKGGAESVLDMILSQLDSRRKQIAVIFGALEIASGLRNRIPCLLCGDSTNACQVAAAEALFGEITLSGVPDLSIDH